MKIFFCYNLHQYLEKHFEAKHVEMKHSKVRHRCKIARGTKAFRHKVQV